VIDSASVRNTLGPSLLSTSLSKSLRFGIQLAIVVGALHPFAPAAAQSAPGGPSIPLRVSVDAPAACSDAAAFLVQLRKHTLRVREAAADERARTIHVALRSEDGRFVGALTVREPAGGEGHREVRGADCPSVVAGLAFVAAVIVDPAAALGTAPAMSSSNVAADTPVAAPSTAAAETPGAPPFSPGETTSGAALGSSFRLSAGAGIEMARGLGPDTAVIPRLSIDFEFPRLFRGAHVRLSGGRGLARSVKTDFGTADIGLTDVRLDPCLDVVWAGSFQLGACGIVDGVVLAGTGTNTWQPESADRLSVELGLGLRPRWVVLRSVVLEVMIGGAAPLARYRFFFAPDATAYRLAAVAGFAEFAAGVRFW
jgi:hypothetical protein